ncbi:ribonuclease H-like domain-containing protein [Tanacetum coccineum]
MVPKAVLMRFGLVSLTTARLVNTAQPRTTVNSARPMTNVFNKAHSTVRRPINNKPTTKNSNFNQRVNTIKDINVNAARPKAVVNIAKAKAVLNAIKGNQVNDVKASAYLEEKGVIDSGCSRHMTRNMSYLTDFEEIDGGYVAFGALGFIRPFGCPVTILNTIDHLGKFDGKADEGFFAGYSINSNAFRVFNNRTIIVEENLHVQFSENTPNIAGSGPNWHFDIDALTKLMNYKPTIPGKDYILLPLWPADPLLSQSSKSSPDDEFKPSGDDEKKITEKPGKEGGDSSKDSECSDQGKEDNVNSTNNVNAASTNEVNVGGVKTSIELPNDLDMPELEDIVYSDDDEDVGAEADMNNLDAFMPVSPIPTKNTQR